LVNPLHGQNLWNHRITTAWKYSVSWFWNRFSLLLPLSWVCCPLLFFAVTTQMGLLSFAVLCCYHSNGTAVLWMLQNDNHMKICSAGSAIFVQGRYIVIYFILYLKDMFQLSWSFEYTQIALSSRMHVHPPWFCWLWSRRQTIRFQGETPSTQGECAHWIHIL